MVTRILLSLIILPVLAFFIFARNQYVFGGLALIATAAAVNEVYSMFKKKGKKTYRVLGTIAVLATVAAAGFETDTEAYFLIPAFFMIAAFTGAVLSRKTESIQAVIYTAMPVIYIGFMGSFGIHLRFTEHGIWWIFLLFLLTLVYDGGAYFTGSAIGRHKLIPELSPGKSIEGCAGGVIINAVTAAIIYYTVLPEGLLGESGIIHITVLSVILSVTGQIGDIAASAVKRYAGVKNSSNLLPELGGVLDKIDSALFNAPVLFFYLKYVAGIPL